MAGQYRPLTFCIYRFFTLEAGAIVDAVCVTADWQGSDPPEGTGLYLAVPDWARGSWSWFALQGHANAWHTIEGGYAAQGDGNDFLVVVDYSNTDVEIRDIFLEIRQEDEITNDAWLYYTEPLTDGEDTYFSIRRVDPSTAHHQAILNGDATISYSRPLCAVMYSEPELFFVRLEAGEHEEIWKSGLDGSDPGMILGAVPLNLQPVGFRGAQGYYVYLRQIGDQYFLQANRPSDDNFQMSDNPALDGCWDPSDLAVTFSALYVKPHDTIADATEMWLVSRVGSEPDMFDKEQVVLGGQEERYMYLDPSAYQLLGNSGLQYGFLFTAGVIGEGTSLYRYPGVSWVSAEPQLIAAYPGRDLRWPVLSPDGRWLAYLSCEPGEQTGDLLVSEFALGRDAVPILVAQNATGRPSWYDPTP